MCWYSWSSYYLPPLTDYMKCSCVCRWRQEVSVVYSRHQQYVLWVALAAAGGAKWPGPPQCPAHLPHQCGHRSGKRRGQASGHSRQPCCHRQHPQDRQGGERRGFNGLYSVWAGNVVLLPVLDTCTCFFVCSPNCCYIIIMLPWSPYLDRMKLNHSFYSSVLLSLKCILFRCIVTAKKERHQNDQIFFYYSLWKFTQISFPFVVCLLGMHQLLAIFFSVVKCLKARKLARDFMLVMWKHEKDDVKIAVKG